MNIEHISKVSFKKNLILLFVLLLSSYPIADLKPAVFSRSLPLYIGIYYLLAFFTIFDWKSKPLSQFSTYSKCIWCFAILLLIQTLVSMIVFDVFSLGPTLIAITYIFIPLIFVENIKDEYIFKKMLIAFAFSLTLIVLYGYYGFVTQKVGVKSEHLLFYWGVRYTQSTRNSDVLFPVLLSFLLASTLFFGQLRIYKKVIITVVCVLSFAAVLLSQSRSGWLACFSGFAYLSIRWLNKKDKRPGYKLLIILITAFLIVGSFQHIPADARNLLFDRMISIFTFSQESKTSNLERLEIANFTLSKALLNPFGVGWANAIHFIRFDGKYFHAENAYLNILFETGWVGFGLFIYILFFPFIKNVKNNSFRLSWIYHFIVSTHIGVVVYLLFNTTVNNIMFWVILGIQLCGSYIFNNQVAHKK